MGYAKAHFVVAADYRDQARALQSHDALPGSAGRRAEPCQRVPSRRLTVREPGNVPEIGSTGKNVLECSGPARRPLDGVENKGSSAEFVGDSVAVDSPGRAFPL
jgi:hypothetical protein